MTKFIRFKNKFYNTNYIKSINFEELGWITILQTDNEDDTIYDNQYTDAEKKQLLEDLQSLM